jgi:hypothetical protein
MRRSVKGANVVASGWGLSESPILLFAL